MTMTPTPTERIRAHLITELGRFDDAIADARRQIAALATRADVQPQAMLQDLGVLERRVREAASARWALADVLELLNHLGAREVGE